LNEISEPDPWEQIKGFLPDTEIVFENEGSNSPFSGPEVERILQGLDRLQLSIQQRFSLAESRAQILQSEIEYLKEQVKRQGRLNWKQIFVRTMVTLAIKLALPPDARQTVWDLVKECFGTIRALITLP